MAELSGKSPEELEKELAGVSLPGYSLCGEPGGHPAFFGGFEPLSSCHGGMSTFPEKVRQKLRDGKSIPGSGPSDNQKETARRNVEALEAVQPQDLGAGEIGVRIGANWVPIEVYQQFMVEAAHPPITMCGTVSKSCAPKPPANGAIREKNADRSNCKSQYHLRHQADERLPHSGADSKSKGCAWYFDYIEDENGKKKACPQQEGNCHCPGPTGAD